MDDNTFIILCLAFIAFAVAFIFYIKWKRNKEVDKWLLENKYARKIYLETVVGVNSRIIRVQNVNGEKPKIKSLKGQNILYLNPGRNTIKLTCSCTRPDVLRKSVTTIYGPIEMDMDIDHYVDYKITFDKKSNKFIVSEIRENK